MSTSRRIDQICVGALVGVLLITFFFINADRLGVQAVSAAVGYESRLFNTSVVHEIDIVMDDWDDFVENCTNEEYVICTVIIDGEAYKNVAIRAKGNTSLTQVEAYGNNRYSFKIEFDHYDSANSYYGLDKLCLNNIIQDNTYMKDYLTYQLMYSFGVDAPLCSYAYITVNGEDWGLYLAVEGVEEAFLQRNYGNDYGNLYKPDSMTMGGGRGNGKGFAMDEFHNPEENVPPSREGGKPDDAAMIAPGDTVMTPPDDAANLPPDDTAMLPPEDSEMSPSEDSTMPPEGDFERQMPDEFRGKKAEGMDRGMPGKDRGMGDIMGSSDVSLLYTDDEYDSYSNIFENVKTTITDEDKSRLIASLKQLKEAESVEDILDIEEVIRYFVVHNFVLNFDSYTGTMMHNYYLYEKDGQLSMIPWDYNLAFGGFMSESGASALINYPIDTPVSGGTIEERPMLAWIYANEEYMEYYHQYFAEFLAKFFDNGYFTEMIDSIETMIAPYVEKDPTKFCSYEEFEEGVSTLKEFCLLRAQSISGQLDGTIPSTSDGQSADNAALIDGKDINISAMGSMMR